VETSQLLCIPLGEKQSPKQTAASIPIQISNLPEEKYRSLKTLLSS
jgi:hypothetical protein